MAERDINDLFSAVEGSMPEPYKDAWYVLAVGHLSYFALLR